jgi:hypothetical protein
MDLYWYRLCPRPLGSKSAPIFPEATNIYRLLRAQRGALGSRSGYQSAAQDENWGKRNQRRLDLIRKSIQGELSEPEQAELDQLQGWLDARFQPFDAGLLKQLDDMKQAVAQLSHEQSDE